MSEHPKTPIPTHLKRLATLITNVPTAGRTKHFLKADLFSYISDLVSLARDMGDELTATGAREAGLGIRVEQVSRQLQAREADDRAKAPKAAGTGGNKVWQIGWQAFPGGGQTD